MTETNKPVINQRDRNLSASVFCRKVDLKGDGKLVPMYSVCLQRSYKKKGDDEWQRETINLNLDDCLRLCNLAQGIYNQTLAYASQNKETSAKDYPAQAMDADGFEDGIPF